MLNKNAKERPEVGERKQIAVKRLSPEYWRVNIDNPPLNIMGARWRSSRSSWMRSSATMH
jgi:hypothetical protein